MPAPESIQQYIAAEPAEVRKVLKQMLAIVKKAAPKATERIAWGMPTLQLEGVVLSFAAFQNHLSLFPGPDAIEHFESQLTKYRTSKGTIQFPYGSPIPATLVGRIVRFSVKRNLRLAAARNKNMAMKKRSG